MLTQDRITALEATLSSEQRTLLLRLLDEVQKAKRRNPTTTERLFLLERIIIGQTPSAADAMLYSGAKLTPEQRNQLL